MKRRNILKWIVFAVALATNIFIIANSFVYGEASSSEASAVTSSIAGIINGISKGTINENNFNDFVGLIRKVIGHFGLFGFSAIFTTWWLYLFLSEKKMSYFLYLGGISSAFGFVVACISEFIQLFMPGRSGSMIDVAIDFVGYFIGVLLVIFVIFLAKKPIFNKEPKMKNQAS